MAAGRLARLEVHLRHGLPPEPELLAALGPELAELRRLLRGP